jgi:hypothetical protein
MKTRTYILEAVCCALFLVFGATGPRAQAQTPPVEAGRLSGTLRSAYYFEVMSPGGILPDWDRGYVIQHENKENYSPDTPMVAIYDATGTRVRQGRIWPEGAGSVRVRVTAAAQEGAILAAGWAAMKDGSIQHYVVKTDLAGNTVQTLLTGSFGTERMCEAPDGTIWAVGRDVQDGKVQSESGVLRHYSFAKGLLHSYLPEITVEAVPPGSKGPWFDPFHSYVRCGKDKVYLYLAFTDEYVEVDTASSELKRWKLDTTAVPQEKASGFAVTEDGRVYASFGPSWMGGNIRGLYQIKAETENPIARLLPIAGTIQVLEHGKQPPAGTIILLWGADGNQLVVWRTDEPNGSLVSWVDVIHN